MNKKEEVSKTEEELEGMGTDEDASLGDYPIG